MSETIPDLRSIPRREAYLEIKRHAAMILEGVEDEIAAMATMSALLHHSLGFLWTGFYTVARPRSLLRVGPYQGTLGCLEISFGRGVCGKAAADEETMIVADVHQFEGHITCDARSRSEIVVPVFNRAGTLTAVLDIDSDKVGSFGPDDKKGLEDLMSWFAGS